MTPTSQVHNSAFGGNRSITLDVWQGVLSFMPPHDVLNWVIANGNRKGENTAEGRDDMLLSMVRASGHQFPSALANDTDLIHYTHLRLQGRVVSLSKEKWPRKVQDVAMGEHPGFIDIYPSRSRFYPNDDLFVAIRNKNLEAWDVKTQKQLYKTPIATTATRLPSFLFPDPTENNPRILVMSETGETGQVEVYEASSGSRLCALQGLKHPTRLSIKFNVFFSESILHAFHEFRSVAGWDTNTGTCLYRSEEFGKDSSLWNNCSTPLPSLPPNGAPILEICRNFSPTHDTDDTLSLKKLDSEPIIFQRTCIIEPNDQLGRRCFKWCGSSPDSSPDKKWVVATDSHGMVHVWDAKTTKQLCSLDHSSRNSRNVLLHVVPVIAKFSPDNTLLVTVDDLLIKVWDTETWKCLCSTEEEGRRPFPGIASDLGISFSSNGEQILVLGDLTVRRLQWISPQRFTAATIEDERVSPEKFDLLPLGAKQRIYAYLTPNATPDEAARLFNTPPPWYRQPVWEKRKVDAVQHYVSQLPYRDKPDKPLETRSARTPSNMQRLLRTIYRCFCSAVAWLIDMLASLLPGQWIEKPRWVYSPSTP